ncbi:MAG: hypothetical protein DHS20C09_04560 [marine bacterium B5-7]|nr:MAG: hypothetical protein DHS20C09_04560 [marine bacterium B5-7]
MIIKASQRGGARSLSQHLLNANDNEHVHVHEISGFVSDNLHGAFQEAEAISKGTKCKQFLFSVSLSPPKGEDVSAETFEDAAKRIETTMDLEGQPRVLVFHEKDGRLHAHAVWSRIDAEKLRAINLPYFKNRLMEISKQLYLDNNWKLPEGHINRENRNPLNFTTKQWYQAKRIGENPRQIKQTLKECWAISGTKPKFEQALERNGYYLAKGDRRGYVAVDWRGEVYSLSKWLDVKKKGLQERLGNGKNLQSIAEVKAQLDQKLISNVKSQLKRLGDIHLKRLSPLRKARSDMVGRHQTQRTRMAELHEKRWVSEAIVRQKRLKKGFTGLLQRVTGRRASIVKENEMEALNSLNRDRLEKDGLALTQLQERERLQKDEDRCNSDWEKDRQELKEAMFSNLEHRKPEIIEKLFARHEKTKSNTVSFNL